MKKIEVIVKSKSDDAYSLDSSDNSEVLYIPSILVNRKENFLNHNIKEILFKNKMIPQSSMIDLLNLALAVYSSDQLVSRSNHGHFGWNRFMRVHLPVEDLSIWSNVKELLEEMLSYLSGDKWELCLRSTDKYKLDNNKRKQQLDIVSLFSGGLDSYTGAINFSSDNNRIGLIAHHKQGTVEYMSQLNLANALQNKYLKKAISSFLFFVQAKSGLLPNLGGESSQRARSILFIALGLAIANANGDDINLQVPENGLISLNIPLTKSRMGSLSTRTTHPYFFYLLNKCLSGLGISNTVINPYKYATKGEMLQSCLDIDFLKQTIYQTVSCSKPGYYRRWKGKDKIHCGHCTPCIIRRAAIKKINLDKGNEYVIDVKETPPEMKDSIGRDYNAFKTAINRIGSKNVSLLHIAQSGPLPGSSEDLDQLKQVYIRGMAEVKDFIY